ncbi:Nucleolar protein 6 [Hanseniaspora osmophila]|uniref:Nucleolar protein 6 n=1 Tax=Hanseniaspora osmophila TaxID=56408 RepID=A0A1E5RN67_9ASCO|nr:Nucleolar protein 6 [Hanseniaspora osmophila]
MSETKLTKKQLKSQNFKKSKDERDQEKALKRKHEDETSTETSKEISKEISKETLKETPTTKTKDITITSTENNSEPVKKKRKTRRGKKGKGNGGAANKGNRFLIFVGNLPYNVTKAELMNHFKNCSPDEIRVRPDKGIAFLEFDPASSDSQKLDTDEKDKNNKSTIKASNIQKRMDIALLQNKTMFQDRKINVELTAGGGGNSENRLSKIKTKNEKMEKERVERIDKMIKNNRSSASTASQDSKTSGNTSTTNTSGIHPDRLKMMK